MSAIASASAPPDAITAAHYSDPPPANVALNKLPIDECRGEWAMWGVIATELMLFVCMFGSYYYLGTNKDRWAVDVPPSLKYPFFLLAILLASSFVLERGKVLVKRRAFGAARAALWITVAIGIGFMILQSFEYASHWRHLTPYSDSYGSIFYAITALHGLHVIAGLLLLAYIGILPRYGDTLRSPHRPYQTVTLYWHFVDFVWIWIVLLLYVLPHFQAQAYGR